MATTKRETGPRPRERGFTMVELLAYLGIFTSLTATMIGAEISARRINASEATTLDAMYTVDRIFGAIAEDCDKATGVRVEKAPRHELSFTGGSTYAFRDRKLYRDNKELSSEVHHISFIQTDPENHPRLVKVQLHFIHKLGRDDFFDRIYERTFLIRNYGGASGGF